MTLPLVLLASRLVVMVTGGEGFAPPPAVQVVLRSGKEEMKVEKVTPGGHSLELAPGSWEITCSAPGYWSYGKAFLMTQGRQEVVCSMVPEAQISGELVFSGPESSEELKVYWMSPQESSRVEALPCERRGKRFSCRAPAGKGSLRLRMAGFSSVFFWNQFFPPGSGKDLGKIVLRPGASLTGWLAEGSGKVFVRALPLEEQLPAFQEEVAITADSRGFFHVPGLPAGRYRVWAQKETRRSQPVTVVVAEGRETELTDALVLEEPVTAVVQLTPPRDPQEKPWHLAVLLLDPARAVREEVAKAMGDTAGRVEIPGIIPGDYFLEVTDSLGKEAYFAPEKLGFGPLLLALEGVRVTGKVTLGDEPLVAQLFFGGEFASNNRICPTDQEGKFACTLPQKGEWFLTVKGEGVVLSTLVQVEPAKGRQEAYLELNFPATELRGEVVTAAGKAPESCIVHAEKSGSGPANRFVLTGKNDFVLRGLEEGMWSLRAEALNARSRTALVNVVSGSETPKVVLVLEATRELAGRVVIGGTTTGVVGAQVLAFIVPQLLNWPEEATTDEAGYFSLQLPRTATAVAMVLEAPGFSRRCNLVSLWPREPLEVSVEGTGGTLVVRYPKAWDDRVQGSLVHAGCLAEPLSYLDRWATANRGTVEVQGEVLSKELPRMAPGRYGLCGPTSGEGTGEGGRNCVWGQLTTGGTLELVWEED